MVILSTSSEVATGGAGGGARGEARTEATAEGIAMECLCSGAGGMGGAPRTETERERGRELDSFSDNCALSSV